MGRMKGREQLYARKPNAKNEDALFPKWTLHRLFIFSARASPSRFSVSNSCRWDPTYIPVLAASCASSWNEAGTQAWTRPTKMLHAPLQDAQARLMVVYPQLPDEAPRRLRHSNASLDVSHSDAAMLASTLLTRRAMSFAETLRKSA